jgi:hypothetical protein
MILALTMSSGASLRADIREGREIIAEHQWIDAGKCSSAFALQGFTPRRTECRVFSRARASRRLRRFFLRQAEDFFPHFAAVGGVSRFILQSCDQQSLFTKLRTKLFAFRR